jgi:hypothetical protein
MKPEQSGLVDIGIVTEELLKILLANFDSAPWCVVVILGRLNA